MRENEEVNIPLTTDSVFLKRMIICSLLFLVACGSDEPTQESESTTTTAAEITPDEFWATIDTDLSYVTGSPEQMLKEARTYCSDLEAVGSEEARRILEVNLAGLHTQETPYQEELMAGVLAPHVIEAVEAAALC